MKNKYAFFTLALCALPLLAMKNPSQEEQDIYRRFLDFEQKSPFKKNLIVGFHNEDPIIYTEQESESTSSIYKLLENGEPYLLSVLPKLNSVMVNNTMLAGITLKEADKPEQLIFLNLTNKKTAYINPEYPILSYALASNYCVTKQKSGFERTVTYCLNDNFESSITPQFAPRKKALISDMPPIPYGNWSKIYKIGEEEHHALFALEEHEEKLAFFPSGSLAGIISTNPQKKEIGIRMKNRGYAEYFLPTNADTPPTTSRVFSSSNHNFFVITDKEKAWLLYYKNDPRERSNWHFEPLAWHQPNFITYVISNKGYIIALDAPSTTNNPL